MAILAWVLVNQYQDVFTYVSHFGHGCPPNAFNVNVNYNILLRGIVQTTS